jgi:hypothetical protein
MTAFVIYSFTASWWPMRAPSFAGERLPREIIASIMNTPLMISGRLNSGGAVVSVLEAVEALHGVVCIFSRLFSPI